MVSKKVIAILILVVSAVLFVSYTAFSFDIFNYIFDAKIVTQYQENPYERKALDYPGDPMLSFMHWTHRTYPYGPVWLATTIPLSYAGFQYFLPTYYIFKLLAVASYLATAWFIYKIMVIKAKKHALFAAAFFALNPLILIEFLVSGHNDIYMIFLAALSLYLLVNKKRVLSVFTFLLSVGVKFATGFFAPMWFFLLLKPKQWEVAVKLGVVLGIVAICAASWKSGNFQPWYFSYVLFVASFLSYKKYIIFPAIIFSFFCLLQYSPFLYYGHWDSPVPQLLRTMLYTGIATALVSMIYGYKRYPDKQQ